MKQKQTLKAEFKPEPWFEAPPVAPAPFRATRENELERLKGRLLQAAIEGAEPALNAPLRRAANEAVALVWLEEFPLLLLPELFAEKARAATVQSRRQQRVFTRSRTFYAEAA